MLTRQLRWKPQLRRKLWHFAWRWETRCCVWPGAYRRLASWGRYPKPLSISICSAAPWEEDWGTHKPSITQIERHYILNLISPELNLEKLQHITTSRVSPAFKIKWLEYFNSSASTREACKLPPRPINEEKLGKFPG